MKRTFLGFLVGILALVLVLGFIGSGVLLQRATHLKLPAILHFASNYGLKACTVNFSKASFTSFKSARWHDVTADCTVFIEEEPIGFFLRADAVSFSFLSWQFDRAEASVSGFALYPSLSGMQREQKFEILESFGVDGSIFRTDFPFDMNEVGKHLSDGALSIVSLVSGEASWIPIDLEAWFRLEWRKSKLEAPLFVVAREGGDYVEIGKEELGEFVGNLEEKYTQPEIELLSEYPVRVVELLRIKERAQRVSQNAAKNRSDLPEDAYRHILWSYLLTRAFGPEFAEKVTDAHEAGLASTHYLDREMDLINNRIGRSYFLKGIAEGQILSTLLKDDRVIREIPPSK